MHFSLISLTVFSVSINRTPSPSHLNVNHPRGSFSCQYEWLGITLQSDQCESVLILCLLFLFTNSPPPCQVIDRWEWLWGSMGVQTWRVGPVAWTDMLVLQCNVRWRQTSGLLVWSVYLWTRKQGSTWEFMTNQSVTLSLSDLWWNYYIISILS